VAFAIAHGRFDMRDIGAVLDHDEPLPPSGVRLRRIISASSCFGALKADNAPCNSGIMVPKLCIVPLDELLGIFHRGLSSGHTSSIARLIRPSLSMM
jgi:hypothetical protein